ncbi:hypothetical protein [Neobacillus dielmonensis]|uniref:hypothetical protein n=1 Tax=Neobacillus dielmonensis TaxID=1347369 RepID=UPI0005A773F5|nr:hypothetical protein [Neobacillus dielmonensis]
MRGSYIVLLLVVLAWPLYYLYEKQLGAVSFLALAIIFGWISFKEVQKLKSQEKNDEENKNQEKIK